MADSNGNGIPDGLEDGDGDGLSNAFEIFYGLNPLLRDTNGNGIPDGDEDPDGDRLSNRLEERAGTHPFVADTDGDGFNDEAEISGGSDPLNPRSRPLGTRFASPPMQVLIHRTLIGEAYSGQNGPAVEAVALVPANGQLPLLLNQPPVEVFAPGWPSDLPAPFHLGHPPVEVHPDF